jgi:hypothetical protein
MTEPVCGAVSSTTGQTCGLPPDDPHIYGHRAEQPGGTTVVWANTASPERVEPAP